MRKSLLIVFTLICCSAEAQKWGVEFGINYIYAKPTGGMGQIIPRGNGVTFNYGWVKRNQRLALGIDFAFAEYGRDKTRQEYNLDDGTTAPMDIIVSSAFINMMAYSKWYLTA